jgi:hypothetical protein
VQPNSAFTKTHGTTDAMRARNAGEYVGECRKTSVSVIEETRSLPMISGRPISMSTSVLATGTFGHTASLVTNNGPKTVVAGDFNRDGVFDIGTGNSSGTTTTVATPSTT